MVDLTSTQKKLYDLVLPSVSQGRIANNPEFFERYFSGELDRGVIPNITLARIKNTDELTWHFVCDRVALRDVIVKGMMKRELREENASLHRNKPLCFVEAACGFTLEWYVLDQISGALVAPERPELFSQVRDLYKNRDSYYFASPLI